MAYVVEEPAAVTHCPTCGARLGSRETHEGERPYCADCDRTLYRNPITVARATVVDGDRALLIEMGEGRDTGAWALPGGHAHPEESLPETAARELAEETGLSVRPADLTPIGTGSIAFADGGRLVSVNFAAPARAAEGTLRAADDAAAARFWTREAIRGGTPADPPALRASGAEQVCSAIDELG